MLPEKEKHLIFYAGLVSLIRIAITPAGEVILFQNQEQFGIGCIFVRIQIENTDKIAGDSGKNIPSDKERSRINVFIFSPFIISRLMRNASSVESSG